MTDVVDSAQLRATMGCFVTGVSVITTAGRVLHGMTANSLTCVSLQPPLVLLCIDNRARMLEALLDNHSFAISILSDLQHPVAAYFADPRRHEGAAEFAGVDCCPGTDGVPLIGGALAWLKCTLYAVHRAGDHHIVVGEVTAAASTDGEPLTFYRGQLSRPLPLPAWRDGDAEASAAPRWWQRARGAR